MKLHLSTSTALMLLSAVPGAFSAKHLHLRQVVPSNEADSEDTSFERVSYDYCQHQTRDACNWVWGCELSGNRCRPGGPDTASHCKYQGEGWCNGVWGCEWRGGKCRPDSSEELIEAEPEAEDVADEASLVDASERVSYDYCQHQTRDACNWVWGCELSGNRCRPGGPDTASHCKYQGEGWCNGVWGCEWRGGKCRPESSEEIFDEAEADDAADEASFVDASWCKYNPDKRGCNSVPQCKWSGGKCRSRRVYEEDAADEASFVDASWCKYNPDKRGCNSVPQCKWSGGKCRSRRVYEEDAADEASFVDASWCKYNPDKRGCNSVPQCKWSGGKCRSRRVYEDEE